MSTSTLIPKPDRPIAWVVAAPFIAALFLLALLCAGVVWMALPKWSRNVNTTPLCENCEYPESQHIIDEWCQVGTSRWLPSDEVTEWRKP